MNTNLALLADFLQAQVTPEKFDLNTFRNGPIDDYFSRDNSTTDEALLHGCGTTACAVGWAALMPEFKAQGLEWNAKRGDLTVNGKVVGYYLQEPLADLFGVSVDVIDWLFFPDSYDNSPTLTTVVARMRHIIGGNNPY